MAISVELVCITTGYQRGVNKSELSTISYHCASLLVVERLSIELSLAAFPTPQIT